MTTLQRLDFNEEQYGFVQSILKEHRMSRVAMITYLVKFKEADTISEADYIWMTPEDMKHFISDIIDRLSKMTDEEYSNMMFI